MGRTRKNGDPFGLAGTRLAYRRNKFWYRHRSGKWEKVGADLKLAKERAGLYNDPQGAYGTVSYWLDMFLVDCDRRVNNANATGKTRMSARTLKDYRGNSVMLKATFGAMLPEQITPATVQEYLDKGAAAGRPVPANRERACLSAMLSWLMRQPGATTMTVNPCMRASGIQRNSESKRDVYVTHEEYRAVYAVASPAVRLMMELCYRTLQRPDSDIIHWTPAIIKTHRGERVLQFKQHKTHQEVTIAVTGQLAVALREALGDVPHLHRPLIYTRNGEGYTYDGLSTMLKKAQAKVRAAGGLLANMQTFGFRDLKGKGATDMWLGGVPIEQIQLLCGHAKKETTEIYVKARWSQPAAPNKIDILAESP